MARISSRGEIVETSGELPAVGAAAPVFSSGRSPSPVTLADYAGSRLVLNIFPSIDTPTCTVGTAVQRTCGVDTQYPCTLCVRGPAIRAQPLLRCRGIANVETASVYRTRLRPRLRRVHGGGGSADCWHARSWSSPGQQG